MLLQINIENLMKGIELYDKKINVHLNVDRLTIRKATEA